MELGESIEIVFFYFKIDEMGIIKMICWKLIEIIISRVKFGI